MFVSFCCCLYTRTRVSHSCPSTLRRICSFDHGSSQHPGATGRRPGGTQYFTGTLDSPCWALAIIAVYL